MLFVSITKESQSVVGSMFSANNYIETKFSVVAIKALAYFSACSDCLIHIVSCPVESQ
jgi:hypothetical protein